MQCPYATVPAMWRYMGISVVLILTATVYWPILQSEYVAYDDELLIVDNVKARGVTFTNVKEAFRTFDPELYIPLTLLSYQLEYSMVGDWDPAVSHGMNLAIHLANTFLVFVLMSIVLRRFHQKNPTPYTLLPTPFLVALLWAIHPLNVEAVAWAAARKDLLSGFFFLFSVCGYLQWRARVTLRCEPSEPRRALLCHGSWLGCGLAPHHDQWYWSSIIAFLLGLLSKVSIAPLPLVLLLLEWFLPQHPLPAGEGRVRGLRSLLPFFTLSLIFIIIALIGKETQVRSLGVTILAPFVAIPFYLQKLFIPTGLSILYPFTEELTIMHLTVLVGLFIVSVLTLFAVWSLRWTRGIASALGIFFLLLAPSFLNVARRGDAGIVDLVVASDRYMYLPSLVLILFLVVSILSYAPHPNPLPMGEGIIYPLSPRGRAGVRGIFLLLGFVGLLGFFGFLSSRQLRVWHDSEALFRNVLTQHQASHIAANNLAGFLARRGEIAQAMDLYQQSIAIRENPRALFNLGRLLIREKRFPEALPLFQKYVAMKPRDAFGRMQLGGLYLLQDDPASARPHLEVAVTRDLHLTEAHYLLGVALERLGNRARARREFEETLRLNPNHTHAKGKLGRSPLPMGEG